MFKCGICGREFDSVEERSKHEQNCVAVHKEEEEKAKFEETKRLAKADEERIQKEYEQLTKDIKHHKDTYGERVSIDTNKVGNIDSPFYIRVRDPFWELDKIF